MASSWTRLSRAYGACSKLLVPFGGEASPSAWSFTRNGLARELHGSAPSNAAGVTTTDGDISTGLERTKTDRFVGPRIQPRQELEHEKKGGDLFADDYAWIHAPPGTIEKPVVVTSDYSERIVGVTDPEDDNSVIWGRIREGEPPKQIVEGGEYFVLKRN